jgi:hypothetical protein
MQKAGSRFPEGLLIRLFLSPSACPLFLGRRTPYRTVHLNSTPPLAQVHIVRTAKAIWFSQPPAPPLSSLAGPYLVTGAFCPWCSCDDLSTLFILCIAVTSALKYRFTLFTPPTYHFTRRAQETSGPRPSTGLQPVFNPPPAQPLYCYCVTTIRHPLVRKSTVYTTWRICVASLHLRHPHNSAPPQSPVPSPQHTPALGLFRESAGLRLFAASSAQLPQSS